jgi:hypothetical protein
VFTKLRLAIIMRRESSFNIDTDVLGYIFSGLGSTVITVCKSFCKGLGSYS